MRAEIISVGTELLLGDIVNTNAQFLAQQLAGLGFSVYYQTVVGDNPARLRAVVTEAKSRSDVLIFTGGLGPTEDDLTKETVAEAFGDILVMDPEELAKLEAFFARRGVKMGENNRKQAMVPMRGRKLLNPNGTAPGAFFRQGSKYAILMPGPPKEMKPMFFEQVVPILESMQDSAIRSLTLRVFGIGESALEEKVIDLLDNPNPTAALYAKTGEVHIRITAKAATTAAADAMCEEYAILFKRVLGTNIYSDDGGDLAATCVRLLVENGKTVATAESCTGGLLGERITSVPGSSAVYGYGAITYSNEAKHQMLRVSNATLRRVGAVSSQVAAEMAFGAAIKGHDDFGIGITGIAGPDGGTVTKPVGLVYVALASGREVWVKKLSINDRGREYVRELATQHALDMLRRVVQGLEVPEAKRFTKSQEADFDRAGRPQGRGGPVRRAFIAFVLAALALVAVMLGIWLAGRGGATGADKPPGAPSSLGLSYGTEEYNKAAFELVRRTRQENPSVSGFLAMPGTSGEVIENLVAQPSTGGQQALADALNSSDVAGMPVMAAGASPAKTGANVLVLGGQSLEPMLALQNTENVEAVSTFTYYTSNDAKVYQVFSVFVADEAEVQAAGFDPTAEQLDGYADYMDFVLGTKARSLYDVPVAPTQQDSFMTLAVGDPDAEGRRLYVCGQLVPPGQEMPAATASLAAAPLMPTGWYAAQKEALPDVQQLYNYWMRWFLTSEQTNTGLQLLCGMPESDSYPMVTPVYQRPTLAEEDAATGDPGPAASGTEEGGEAASAAGTRFGETEPVDARPVVRTFDDGQGASATSGGDSNAQAAEGGSGSAQSAGESSASGTDGTDVTDNTSGEEVPSEPSSSAPAVYIPPQPKPQRADPSTLTVTMNGRQVTAPTADILAQICQAEVAGAAPDVIRAVAIAAHSWILNQQGAGAAAPPVVGRQPSAATRSTVGEVANLMLSGDGKAPAFAPWYAMAARGTNSAELAFGAYRSYLGEVSSPYEENMDNWRGYLTVAPEVLEAAAREKLGVELSAIGEAEQWITSVETSGSGYVKTIKLGDTEVTGMDFWQKVLLDEAEKPVLPSPAFEVSWDGEAFSFITYGQGHGCGMSLAGAAGYAREGWDYERILEHYYPDAKLVDLTE